MTFSLEELATIVDKRSQVRDGSSYTASLVTAGMEKAAQKLGEEAVESVIAAVTGEKALLIGESADLLYHLCVVWHLAGITPDEIMQELEKRTRIGGLAEKAARQKVVSAS